MCLRVKDLTGLRFGRVTVLRFHGQDPSGNFYWVCRCDCGTEFIAAGNNLKAGYTKSCGCYRREATAARNRARFSRI